MTRVSTGPRKSGPPAYANKTAFVHNRNSRKTRRILAAPIAGLCPACHAVLEWRKRFRKYKPLTVPKRCVRCTLPSIREAYHVVCNACAAAAGSICCKCLQPPASWAPAGETAAVCESLSAVALDRASDHDGASDHESTADYDNTSSASEDVLDLGSPVRVAHASESLESAYDSANDSAYDSANDSANDSAFDSEFDSAYESNLDSDIDNAGIKVPSDGVTGACPADRLVLSDLEGLSDGCSSD